MRSEKRSRHAVWVTLPAEVAVPLLTHVELVLRTAVSGGRAQSLLHPCLTTHVWRVPGAWQVFSWSDGHLGSSLLHVWIRLQCSWCALMGNAFHSSLKSLGIVFDTKNFLNHLE